MYVFYIYCILIRYHYMVVVKRLYLRIIFMAGAKPTDYCFHHHRSDALLFGRRRGCLFSLDLDALFLKSEYNYSNNPCNSGKKMKHGQQLWWCQYMNYVSYGLLWCKPNPFYQRTNKKNAIGVSELTSATVVRVSYPCKSTQSVRLVRISMVKPIKLDWVGL